jgi:hypothetical protein
LRWGAAGGVWRNPDGHLRRLNDVLHVDVPEPEFIAAKCEFDAL